jgi:hypothetical protein
MLDQPFYLRNYVHTDTHIHARARSITIIKPTVDAIFIFFQKGKFLCLKHLFSLHYIHFILYKILIITYFR